MWILAVVTRVMILGFRIEVLELMVVPKGLVMGVVDWWMRG